MTKSSKVESPTTWPFILYCMCCCCLPILVCCIFVIVILIKGGDLHKLKTMGNEFTRSTGLVEGSNADEETSLKNWQFYTMIGVLVILCICCMFFASRAGDCIRNYELSPGQSVPFMWKIL